MILSVVTLPFDMHLNIWVTGLFVLNALLSARKSEFEKDRSVVVIYLSFVILFFIQALSLSYSQDLAMGGKRIETQMWMLFVPLAYFIGLSKLSLAQLHLAKRAFLIAIFVAVVTTYLDQFYQVIVQNNFAVLVGSEFENPWMHRGYFGSLIVFAILFWWEERNFLRGLRRVSFILFPITLVLLQGRMSIVTLLILTISYFLFLRMKRTSFPKILAALAGFALILVFLRYAPFDYSRFNEPIKTTYNLQDKESEYTGLTIRLAIWGHAIEAIEENLWMGHGVGDAQKVLIDYYAESDFLAGLENNFNCHNQFLELLLAVGILGALILGLIFYLLFRVGIRIKSPFFIMVVLTYFLSLFTESVLNRYYGVIMLSLIVLLHLKISIQERQAIDLSGN